MKKKSKKIVIRDLTSTMDKKNFNQVFNRYKVLKKLIKNPLVMDIGANEGQTIIEIAKNFKKSKVHSFEANPNLIHQLNYVKNKYKKNSKIKINIEAVGNIEKNINFYLHQYTSQSSPLKINYNSKLFIKMKKLKKMKKFLEENNVKINTKQTTIDKYCKRNKIKN